MPSSLKGTAVNAQEELTAGSVTATEDGRGTKEGRRWPWSRTCSAARRGPGPRPGGRFHSSASMGYVAVCDQAWAEE